MAESDGARQQELANHGKALADVSYALMGYRTLGTDIVGLSIRGPRSEDEEILVTLRGLRSDGAKVVAFFGGASLGAVFTSMAGMLRNGTVSWRDDKY